MSGFGPRTYLIGQILPLLLPGIGTINSRAEDLDEAIRVAMYITDLTLARMGGQIVHDFEDQP